MGKLLPLDPPRFAGCPAGAGRACKHGRPSNDFRRHSLQSDHEIAPSCVPRGRSVPRSDPFLHRFRL